MTIEGHPGIAGMGECRGLETGKALEIIAPALFAAYEGATIARFAPANGAK